MVTTKELKLQSSGPGDIIDITAEIQQAVRQSGLNAGTVTTFVPGSTGGLTTIEYEPGLIEDLPAFFEKLIPSNISYQHDRTWGDGNGFSHLRAALIGPDITVPFAAGKLLLGTWQQVVFLEFDNKARSRGLILQIMGE